METYNITYTRVNDIDYVDYNDGRGRKERYIATSTDGFHWYGEVYVGHPYGYVPVKACPPFKDPTQAILWTKNWKEGLP